MKIGILTSGGDAPGMNAAIRAVVRTAVYHHIDVLGIKGGYDGLLKEDIIPMNVYSVANIIDKGGTILKSSRSDYFKTAAGQKATADILKNYGIDHLVVIGGDGTLTGGLALKQLGVSVVGIPATIDNDFGASTYSIGFDTAVTTAMDAILKIRDTTSSHNRINVVQVMGRSCGDIALYAGFGVGAEAIIIPEIETNLEGICERLIRGKERGKMHSIVMLAEGCGGYREYCEKIENLTEVETRGTNLGYIQRGGSPTHQDRYIANNMGYMAVDAVIKGNTGTVAVLKGDAFEMIPLEEALNTEKIFNKELYRRMKILSI